MASASPARYSRQNASWRAIALAVISQVGGQGLVAVALGTLPATFSSLVIFLEAVAAALNSRPRKTLGWKTPAEVLTEYLSAAA